MAGFAQCTPAPPAPVVPAAVAVVAHAPAASVYAPPAAVRPPDYDSSAWLELVSLDSTIVIDIRYATPHNFMGEAVYDCGRCFFRPAVARALLAAHRELRSQGQGLKMFDCYRPRPVQWKLWNHTPDPRFVADPRKGSVHNRGGAADLTIVDLAGHELPMGTEYDYFGPEGYHGYPHLPDSVLANRLRLKEVMARHGFAHIRTEWWHYNYRPQQYGLSDWEWPCQ